MKKLVLSILFLIPTLVVFGQGASLKGKVIDSKSLKPLANVLLTIESTNDFKLTKFDGVFLLNNLPTGSQSLIVTYNGYLTQVFPLELNEGEVLDIGTVVLEEDVKVEQQLSLITITDNDLNDGSSGSESTSGLLQATRDVFQQAAAFNWGQARFRVRGLDNEYGVTMINGLVMNKISDRRPQWSNWGGLNDATRNQEFTMGSAPSDYTFGGALGTQEINTRASFYRAGTRLSFSGSNTNYNGRIMATHAQGLDKDGWAYVVSGSRRWAQEGHFEGTDYAANSLFATIEKKINDKHSIDFTTIYAQNSRGRNSANTDEVNNLQGIRYNSLWGWQDGEKRNSRDRDIEEPILILSHYWNINSKINIKTNIGYQFGFIGNSRLDFQNVTNPDPTYYRNLPSYFTSLYNNNPADVPASAFLPGGLGGIPTPDFVQAQNANFLTSPQINWENMYAANTTTGFDANGNTIRIPSQSKYVLYEDRIDDKTLSINSIMGAQLSDNIAMNAGFLIRRLKSENFQNVLDLLGGAYFEDIDNFQTGSAQETDLNNPGRRVVEGDRYGYNYNLFSNNIDVFTQFKFTYNKIDFYLSQSFARSEYQREGLYRNGIYPNRSFGKSDKLIFDDFGFKGGLTYKITGRHLVDFNALYMTKAPSLRNAFPNARLNNSYLPQLSSESISSLDISYIIRAPKLKTRVTAFYSNIQNINETSFFFAEGAFEDVDNDGGNAFVAEIVSGLDRLNFGAELGIEYQLTSTLKINSSVAYGQHTFNSNPNVVLNNDNNEALNRSTFVDYGQAKMKGLKQPGMPQQAYSVGIEYRDPNFWWIGANANYLASSYIDVSSLLRTDLFLRNPEDINGFPFPEATEERTRELLKQEKFDNFTLINLTGGKSWRISRKNRNTVGFFASVNNVFDVVYKTGGFEQARNANYRQLNQDVSSGTPAFAPRYFYGFGRTYFVNFYINF